ncbi:variable large family protein [Borrelia turicatae]|uniref:variable large family protein n=1 Tax=Borrelia turicatae TaxID=142 RepID=UPI001FF4CC0A|nr:variable large family protein [Borrelia turicatae]UPA14298.1 variable large family protein [Borrelia turicatae 91E135]
MKRITLSALLMTLFLLLSCGSGSAKVEDPKTTFLNSIANLGKGFLDVFTSLSDMITGAFGIKADTKKSDIGKYFTSIETTMNTVKEKLQDEVEKNGNYSKLKSVVDTFITNTLDKIAEGAKIAAKGAEGNDPIGNVAEPNGGAGVAAGSDAVKTLSEGISNILSVVLKNEGNPEAGDDKKATDGSTARTNGNAGDGEAGKLFATANAGTAENAKKSAADSAKAVGAVTGADILKAMIKDNGDAAKLARETTGNAATPKDATIAGAIVLRAMAKDGKFANASDADAQGVIATTVKRVAISAVTKALNALTIAIRNTVYSGLKTISEALAAIKQEDKSADSTTPAEAATGGQQQ